LKVVYEKPCSDYQGTTSVGKALYHCCWLIFGVVICYNVSQALFFVEILAFSYGLIVYGKIF
jgi:hypothetical protein